MTASETPSDTAPVKTVDHEVAVPPAAGLAPNNTRIRLQDVDLRIDPLATVFVKDEVVGVVFAKAPGTLLSLEGPNAYDIDDALVQAASGERWVVSRARFDPKYLPADASLRHGHDGAYRNRPVPVLAKRMDQPFTIARSTGGDHLQGAPGDWLLQYAPADYGVVQQARFARVYRAVPDKADARPTDDTGKPEAPLRAADDADGSEA